MELLIFVYYYLFLVAALVLFEVCDASIIAFANPSLDVYYVFVGFVRMVLLAAPILYVAICSYFVVYDKSGEITSLAVSSTITFCYAFSILIISAVIACRTNLTRYDIIGLVAWLVFLSLICMFAFNWYLIHTSIYYSYQPYGSAPTTGAMFLYAIQYFMLFLIRKTIF